MICVLRTLHMKNTALYVVCLASRQGWGAEPGVFGSLEPEPLEKKPGAEAAWKKSQELEPLKNLPAPHPSEKIKSIRKL